LVYKCAKENLSP